MSYLHDKHFLKQIDQQTNQEKYVKITALNFNDQPLGTIEGIITGGSINVDGASAVRRTCSLSFAAGIDNPMVTEPYWCFNTKIEVQIGLRNFVNSQYPDIIWFDMGIFLLSSFSISESTNALNISLQGKDKMCRLNGEMGGAIPAQWDWGAEEYVDYETGVTTTTKIPLKTIIYNIVRELAQERPENIIIRDLDTYGYELWEYMGEEPMYYLRDNELGNIHQVVFKQNTKITVPLGNIDVRHKTVSTLEDVSGGKYYSTNTIDPNYNNDASVVCLGWKAQGDYQTANYKYNVIRIASDETAGYHQIPLVFNSDLIAKAGETGMSVLDKIKNMLGNYEYFYNTKGQFVFQKKNDYVQELYSTSSGALTTPMVFNDMYSYRFEDETMLTNIGISPNMGNLKNDFVVWGTRSADKLPIHARCAVDTKPTKYVSPWSRIYRVGDVVEPPMKNYVVNYYYKESGDYKTGKYTGNNNTTTFWYDTAVLKNTTPTQSGYQLFYYKKEDKFYSSDHKDLSQDGENCIYELKGFYSPDSEIVSVERSLKRKSGGTNLYSDDAALLQWTVTDSLILLKEFDKNLYVELCAGRKYDIEGYDWRELIYQMAIDYRKHGTEPDYYILLEQYNPEFNHGCTGYEPYYIDLEGFWRQLYDPTPYNGEITYGSQDNMPYWNIKIHTDPNKLLFWFEFFDTEGELNKYSVRKVGQRPKVVNENTVTSIYNKQTPEVQFIIAGSDETKETNTAYTPIQITEQDELLFYRSAQGLSAIERINNLIFNHLSTIDGLSLTTVPIYYLQPNTRIYVAGYGDYTISKLSYNLNYNGTMNISGSKIYKQWY